MNNKKEIKAGIIALVALLSLFWGFNFLKGRDVLSNTRIFYAEYNNIDGLTKGRPVTLNGLQIGSVTDITFMPDMSGKLIVKLEIDNEFPFSTNSLLKIYGADLMGAKSLSIVVSKGDRIAISGDTLRGAVEPAITTVLNDEVQPLKKKIERLLVSVDSTSNSVRMLLEGENKKNIEGIMKNLNKTLSNFAVITNKLKSNTDKIDSIFYNVNSMTKSLKVFADSLNEVKIASTVNNFNKLIADLSITINEVNNGEGTMSKLLHDKELYDNLAKSTKELNELLEDVKLNPDRYIHVSVFGKKTKEYKEPEKIEQE